MNRKANINAADKLESNHQLIAEYKEKISKNPSQNSTPVDGSPAFQQPWPTSNEEDFDFDTNNVPKPNLTKLMNASQQFRKNLETNIAL